MAPAILLLAALAAPQDPAAAPARIAVTASGFRVECLDAEPGDRQILTPFGGLLTALDPVAAVEDGRAQRDALLALHATGQLDDLGLAQDLSTAGQLTALAQHLELFARRAPERLEPYLMLEAWGARLDPVPPALPRERRVAWLWERAQDGDWARTVLAAAWLRDEVSEAYQPDSDRVVGLSDLRKALRRPEPQHRRAAALVAGRQREFSMREALLMASLQEPLAAARDGAAWASNAIHPHSARNYWARNLARGLPQHRERAATALGCHAGTDGVRVLMHVLAAHERKTSERFRWGEREIWVVGETDRGACEIPGFDARREDKKAEHLHPSLEYVDLGSTFRVTRYGDELTTALLHALDLWAGERTGRGPEDWLSWYLASVAAETP